MVSRNLPEIPNLEHLRKQAKALLRDFQKRDPQAKLAQAQLSIARQYGFASWTKLKAHVESLPAAASGGAGGGEMRVHTVTGDPSEPGLFPRFTPKSRRMVFFSRYWAAKRGSQMIDPDHVVLGLLQEDPDFPKRLVGNPSAAERMIHAFDPDAKPVEEIARTHPVPLSNESRRILQLAAEESDRLGHISIATGHFWLALLGQGSPAISVLKEVLKQGGVSEDRARKQILEMIQEELR